MRKYTGNKLGIYLAALSLVSANSYASGRGKKPKTRPDESSGTNTVLPQNSVLSHQAISRIYSGPGENIGEELFKELVSSNDEKKNYLTKGPREKKPRSLSQISELEKHLLMNLGVLSQPVGALREIYGRERYDSVLERVKHREVKNGVDLTDREILFFGNLIFYAINMEPIKSGDDKSSRIIPANGVQAYRALEQAELFAQGDELKFVTSLKEELHAQLMEMRGEPKRLQETAEERIYAERLRRQEAWPPKTRQLHQLNLHIKALEQIHSAETEKILNESLKAMGYSLQDFNDFRGSKNSAVKKSRN